MFVCKMVGYVAKQHFDMVALIFVGIDSFIFNFPAGAAGFDQLNEVLFAQPLGGNPAVVILFDPLPPNGPTG